MNHEELNQILKEKNLSATDIKKILTHKGMEIPKHFTQEISRHRSGKKPISNVWEAFYRSL
jgi:hypothetical protein